MHFCVFRRGFSCGPHLALSFHARLDKWLQVNKSLAKWNRLETPCSCNRTPWTDSRGGVRQLFFISTILCTTSKGHYKRRNNHCSTLIVVYSKLEIAGNRFQTKLTEYTWTHFTPKTNNSAELQQKKVCGCPNSLGTPSMNESWAYVSIAVQGASWVLPKTQREDLQTKRFVYIVLIHATAYFITLSFSRLYCLFSAIQDTDKHL